MKGKQTDVIQTAPVNEQGCFNASLFPSLSLPLWVSPQSDSLVPAMINAAMNGFLFHQALWEKGFFRSFFLS